MSWRRRDVNAADGRGQTALYGAALMGYDDVVKFLLSKGADPKITTSAAPRRSTRPRVKPAASDSAAAPQTRIRARPRFFAK